MTNEQKDPKVLSKDLENVIEDTQHFLSDLKGHRSTKRLVKKDVKKLKQDLHKLIAHVDNLEENHL